MPDETLTFKEMCARFDVNPRTRRYYEYIELLSPAKQGRTRFYGPRELARMKLILRGRRFGFSHGSGAGLEPRASSPRVHSFRSTHRAPSHRPRRSVFAPNPRRPRTARIAAAGR